jgi:putative transposase
MRAGHVSKQNRKTQEQFTCVQCGLSENADLLGAINVLRAGHAQLACQVNCDVSSQQQEPPSIAA